MKVITCASYYGSGSSAITDLISEYSNVKALTDYEFRFLHDLDGVSDLEYQLCDCHNRQNAGHALKRFIRLSEFYAGNRVVHRYEPFFGNQYMKLTREYVEELTDFKYYGWWFYDLYDKGSRMYYLYQFTDKLLKKITGNRRRILSKEMTLCAHPSKEKFLDCTKKYVHDLLEAANKENMPYIEVDQIVASQNINRISRYFSDELFVFVIDRDPRDVYTLSKFYWFDTVNPYKDVNEFCDWYLYTRKSGSRENVDKKHVCNIHFEDFVYNYEATVKKIEDFTGLSSKNHIEKFSKLNPKKSVNNTKIWKRHKIDEDINIIEERLGEYLYPFCQVEDNIIAGTANRDSKIF